MEASPATLLPPELLLEVFSHLLDESNEFDQQSLKSSTLVCRKWSEPAQSILWQSGATLQGDKDVQKFVGTASRRRVGPKEILVYGLRNVKLLPKLWESIAGVESLVIVSEGGNFSTETFNHSALLDLRSLALKGSLLPSNLATRLPFKLDRLNINDTGIRTRHLASFLSSIAQSSAPTLSSLSLLSVSGSSHPEVSAAILPFAPNLRHFGLSIDSKDDSTPYVPLFESASSLKSFECTSLPLSLLHSLPTTLKGFATMEDLELIDIDQLKIALQRLKGIERLYFACERKAFRDVEGGEELLVEAEKRKIVWNFAEDY
ncbi:hypothetical protein JCM5350_002692 [Sporobolomyces pararoseus]